MSGSLEFCLLSSGSRANCTYVGFGTTKILIDCGLSCREVTKRLRVIGIEPEQINGIVVTHEHSDHIAGIPVFVKKHQIPVYTNVAQMFYSGRASDYRPELTLFETGISFSVGELEIEPVSIRHDAHDPVGFRISAGGRVLFSATDAGHLTTLVREKARGAQAIILEANHDLDMLMNESPYPWALKQRIHGRHGHLQNEDAGELLAELSARGEEQLEIVVAAHVSEKSNLPELALEGLKAGWRRGGCESEPKFYTSSAFEPTAVFRVGFGIE